MKNILLLRHADIDTPVGPAPDTWPLNALGQARADALAHVVGEAGVTAIFASPATRTQETVRPLATRLNNMPIQIPASLQQLVQQAISDRSGSVVLIAGHSNTVPQIINALGAPFPLALLQGHDDLIIVSVTGPVQATATRLKYGAPTP